MQLGSVNQGHASIHVNTDLVRIHPTALIDPGAKISPGVSVGPYSIIGKHVSIGLGTTIAGHVTIDGWTHIGQYNQIGIGSIIGGDPQDLKFDGEMSNVIIGDNNIIREYVTINRGTLGGGGKTSIGNNNMIMTSVHVAHDVSIGNDNIISNAVLVGGHVVIEDFVTVGAHCGLHQFIKIGRMSMLGALSLITKDVLPFALVSGNPAKRYGVNIERLRRNGYSALARSHIKSACNIIYHNGLMVAEVIEQIIKEFHDNPDVMHIVRFLKHSTRGVYR